jgi:hypothetical protein
MFRSAHLLCGTIFMAACFACAPLPPPAPPLPPAPITLGTCAGGSTFLSHVSLLAAGYNPRNLGTPPANSSGQLTTQEQTDLNNAFIASPPRFQKALCNLDGIYIDPSNVHSWGFRNPGTGKRYVGLSQAALWGGTGQSPAPKYSDSETSLIQQVLGTIGAPWPTSTNTIPNPPSFSAAENVSPSGVVRSVDTSAMTVLAALAHEYGHILWFDLIKGNPLVLSYDPAKFCRSNPKVAGNGFFDSSWQTVHQPPDYLDFAELPPIDKHYNGLILTQDLINTINGQQWSTAANYLNLFYSPDTLNNSSNENGVWPSLFGSISPEEEFVGGSSRCPRLINI